MLFSTLPYDQILLALPGFVLGILTAIIIQLISREFKLYDAKKKLRYSKLKKVRTWMEACGNILKLEYPLINGFWLSDAIAPPSWREMGAEEFAIDNATEISFHLKKFKDAKLILDRATEEGEEAFELLREKPPLWIRLNQKVYSREVYYYGSGFCIRVLDPLRKLIKILDFLYIEIERDYALVQINWDRLDRVDPQSLHTIVEYPQLRYLHGNISKDEYYEKILKLGDALQSVRFQKSEAERELYRILKIIQKYEDKWIVPES